MGTKNTPGDFDCYEAADPDEPMFVLLARDPLAPALVEKWAEDRVPAATRSLESEGRERKFAKINEARACAQSMRAWRAAHECSDRNCRHSGARHHAYGCNGNTIYGRCDCYGFDPNFDRPIVTKATS